MDVDIKMIESCLKNDRLAQKHLYQNCAPYVYSIIKSYINDPSTRSDLMQDIFINIFKSLHSFDADLGKFKPWISQIATFKCIDYIKRVKIPLEFGLEKVEEVNEDDFRYLDTLQIEEIHDLLINMPLGYKTVFLLFHIDDYSHKEIAEILNITPETSRSQLNRSVNWLKKNLNTSSNKIRYGTL